MKFMNMKRFASTAMAGALALSLAAPVFAANNTTTNITGTYADIPIAVVVPTTGSAQINPYGLPVSITKSNDSTVELSGQKITTRPLSVKNQGAVALEMGVSSFIVVPTGDVSIDTSADADKQISVDLEVAGLNDATLALATDSERLDDLLIDKFADKATWAGAQKLAAPNAAKNAAASAITAAKSGSAMATLGAATVKGDLTTYGKDSIALFRLSGDLAQEPETGTGASATPDPWKETDGFTATIVFKFSPAPASPGDASANVVIAGNTAAATFVPGTSGLTAVSYTWESSDTSVATVAGTTQTATITSAGTTGQTAQIKVTVTLSNGSTVNGSATYTCA